MVAQRLRDAIREEERMVAPNPLVLSLLNCMSHLIVEMEPRFESKLPVLHGCMSQNELQELCEKHIDHYMQCLDTLRYHDALCKHLPHRKVSIINNQTTQETNFESSPPLPHPPPIHRHFHTVI